MKIRSISFLVLSLVGMSALADVQVRVPEHEIRFFTQDGYPVERAAVAVSVSAETFGPYANCGGSHVITPGVCWHPVELMREFHLSDSFGVIRIDEKLVSRSDRRVRPAAESVPYRVSYSHIAVPGCKPDLVPGSSDVDYTRLRLPYREINGEIVYRSTTNFCKLVHDGSGVTGRREVVCTLPVDRETLLRQIEHTGRLCRK